MHNLRRSNGKPQALHSLCVAVGAIGLSVLVAGCAGGPLNQSGGTNTGGSSQHFNGQVYGGQQPVSGATIQLYTVGTSGLKSASTPMLTAAVTTDANGKFSISGDYSCTNATQVYITASGGNPGAGTNSALTMAAALGSCSALLSGNGSIVITINELTTVAAAYALSPFAADLTHIGATGSNPIGMVNAFANAALLSNTTNGAAGGAGLATGVTVPTTELNTLGNIIASCVNTNGASSSTCGTLFSATSASDTFGAALAIAKNPGASAITALVSLSAANAAFQPAMATTPNDFSVAVSMAGNSSLATPWGIAIDASGDAWVTNESGFTVTEFSPTGSVVATLSPAGLVGAQDVALDRAGNVWVANTAGNSVIKFAVSSGLVTGSSSFVAGGIDAPIAIALDSASNAWVANLNGNSVTGLSSVGTAISGSPFTGGGNLSVPTGIAVDASGNIYVTSGVDANPVVKLAAMTGGYSSSLNDGALEGPMAVAVDPAGNVLASGYTTGAAVAGALSEFAPSGTPSRVSPITTSPITPGGLTSDGVSVWLANKSASGSLAQFVYGAASSSGPANGYGSLNAPVGVAVDNSGSVWTANSGSNTVSKFIGIAVPITTPLAANVGP